MPTTAPHIETIYFHGLPGSARELGLVETRSQLLPRCVDPLDFDWVHNRPHHAAPLRVIGFSLGAFSALKLAATYPEHMSELILISPAAPLELGPFLDQMAGAPVFKAAKASPAGFTVLTAAQALMAHMVPRALLKQMFADSCPAEKALLQNPHTVACLTAGLKHALWRAAPLYRRTVRAYVSRWADGLSRVTCDCHIYHGAEDNWAPVEMANALHARLPRETKLNILPALGHYTTLIKVLPDILHAPR